MRGLTLIPTILAVSGAQSVLVCDLESDRAVGTSWRLAEADLVRLVRGVSGSGVRGFVSSDDERLSSLATVDAAECVRYFVAAFDDSGSGLVLFGYTEGAREPSQAVAHAIAQLAAAALEPSAREYPTMLRAGDVVDIANGSAHAIGTPLNVISGHAEAILRSLAEDSPHRRSLATIVEQAHRVADTVRRAVAIVRREPAAKVQPISWPELVADTLAMASAMLKRLDCRARWIDDSSATGVVTVDVPAAIGDLFVILRDLAERVGPKGILMIRPSKPDAGAIEIDGRTAAGASVEIVVYSARQSASASSAT